MTDGPRELDWHAELLSSLDQLSSVRDDLRRSVPGDDAELLAEAESLLAHATLAVGALRPAHPVPDADEARAAGERGLDPLTIVSTVGITTVLLPFVQRLVDNAGDDVYRVLTRLVRRWRSSGAATPDPDRVVLGDPRMNLRVVIDDSVDGTALQVLRKTDLSDPALHGATLRWHPHRKVWEPEPGPRPVSIWLPGDPLDEDWA
jgi:hypothetical protein